MPHKPFLVESRRSASAGVRVVLADDFARWRLQVRSYVQRETDWTIVYEACDGIEAVQKTIELHPDVVILDLNMSFMNGIEATKIICQLSPNSKVVVLTQEKDEDYMTAALQAGAVAYVLKAEMTSALIPAVQAALQARD